MKGPCLCWLVVFALSILLLLPGAATAALTWDADTATSGIQEGAGTWQDGGANWYDNVPWSSASPTVAVFGDASATGEIGEITVADDGVTATGLTFNKGYTLASGILGPSVITLAPDGGATPVITMFKDNNPTINTELSGGDINVDGASGGYLYLGAANSWTGNLSVINPQFTANPAICPTVSDALSPNGTVSVDGGAFISFTVGESISFSTALNLGGYGGGDAAVHAVRGALVISGSLPDVTLSGPITLTADAAFCTSNATTRYPLMVLSGNIGETAGGPKSITTTGVGTIELQGDNTFTGDLIYMRSKAVILNSAVGVAVPGNLVFRSNHYGGELRIAQNEQIGGIIDFAYTGTTADRQIVNLMDVTETLQGIQMTNTTEAVGVVQNGGTAAASLVLDTPEGADYVFNGKLQDGGTGGTLALTKRGIGKQTLAGTCLLSGGTTIEAGTLAVNGAYTSNVTVNAAGTLAGTGTITGDVDLAGILNVGYDGEEDTVNLLSIVGELDLTGGTISFTNLTSGALAEGDYVFATYETLLGNPATAVGLLPNWSVDYLYDYGEGTDNSIALIVGPSALIPGDTDGNQIVNEADAAVLAGNWGANVGAGGFAAGDFNDDQVVNAADAAILAANWGDHTGSEAAPVPEPSSIMLILLGLASLAVPKRRGRRQ